MIGTIYIHTNKANGKCYVGQTWDVEKRWNPSGYNNCARFRTAIKHYGWSGFDHQIVVQQEMTQEEMDNYEKLWIACLNSVECGYNLTWGGGSAGKRSDETRAKNRAANLGKKLSPEHIAKVSAALKGRVFSEEHKRKLREANARRIKTAPLNLPKVPRPRKKPGPMSEEAKIRISEGLKTAYAEGRRQATVGPRGPLTKVRSPEHCQKISEHRKQWWANKRAEWERLYGSSGNEAAGNAGAAESCP